MNRLALGHCGLKLPGSYKAMFIFLGASVK